MKVKIDETCTACGLCAETCPEVFTLDDDDDIAKVLVDEVPAELEDLTQQAVDECPVDAIIVE